MNLIEILDVNLIDLELEASSKDEVIHQLCSLLYENGRVKTYGPEESKKSC